MTGATIRSAIGWIWLAWVAGWWLAAIGNKRTEWRESIGSMALHRVPIWIAAFLLAAPERLSPWLRGRIVPRSHVLSMTGLALVAGGLAFTVWARVYLGRNWSGSITVKRDHSLIQSGPYRHVRHPIYTGLLIAFAGTLLAIPEWRALVAFALATGALIVKSRLEEARMRLTFPEYEDYRRRTAAIVPFVF